MPTKFTTLACLLGTCLLGACDLEEADYDSALESEDPHEVYLVDSEDPSTYPMEEMSELDLSAPDRPGTQTVASSNPIYTTNNKDKIYFIEHAYTNLLEGAYKGFLWTSPSASGKPTYQRHLNDFNDKLSSVAFCNGSTNTRTVRLRLYKHSNFTTLQFQRNYTVTGRTCILVGRDVVNHANDSVSAYQLSYL